MNITTRISKRLYQVLLLTAIILTTACGFHLRGSNSQSVSQQPVYVTSVRVNTVALNELKQLLVLAGAKVVDTPKEAQYRLTLLDEDLESRVASLDNRAQAAEYRIFLSIGFQISDAEGKPLTDPQQVSGSQVYAHDIHRIVAANDEAQLVYSELQDKLIRQVLARYQTTIHHLTTKSVSDKQDGADLATEKPAADEPATDGATQSPPEKEKPSPKE